MSAPTYRCDAIVGRRGGMPGVCKRQATYSTLLLGGRYVRECSQHHRRDSRPWALLAPLPWEVVSTVRTKDEV